MAKAILDSFAGSRNRSVAASTCLEVLANSQHSISISLASEAPPCDAIKDAQAWLNAALAYQYNCWNCFKYASEVAAAALQVVSSNARLWTNLEPLKSKPEAASCGCNRGCARRRRPSAFARSICGGQGRGGCDRPRRGVRKRRRRWRRTDEKRYDIDLLREGYLKLWFKSRFISNIHPLAPSLASLSSTFTSRASLTDQPATAAPAAPPQSQILSIRHALLSRRASAADIARDHLARLRRPEPRLRSFLHLPDDDALLAHARRLDARIAAREDPGPLAGVLVGVKDNICTADMPSTAGSRILEGYRAPFDATAVKRVTANPWDVSRVPGGSSGGSAAAVSARQCVVSLGSDTGGSVRQPASFCGVVGLKPTYGRVSRFGLMAYASSLDAIGCFGSSVADTGILLHAVAGHDRFDATSSKQDVPDFLSHFVSVSSLESKPLKGLRVGLICETIGDGVDAGVISAIRTSALHFEELGCIVNELGFNPFYMFRYGNQDYADELDSLYGGSRAKGFGSEVKMRILMGTYALSAGYYDAYYKRAQQVRTIIRNSFKEALKQNDILICPAAPSAAYKIVPAVLIVSLPLAYAGEKKNDPLAMYAGDIMTVNVNLAGLPALVLPCGFVEGGPAGLPVGLQMIGAAFDEVLTFCLFVSTAVEALLTDLCVYVDNDHPVTENSQEDLGRNQEGVSPHQLFNPDKGGENSQEDLGRNQEGVSPHQLFNLGKGGFAALTKFRGEGKS
ncbi:hypothetical protein Fmac_026958 [Flemingia macrophylla]|uniref:Glutamyl-tRNA(Gln) amidotransferase subunit A, chloroplastic/mitochondrial n=1 Tax=Flemingia macrophylla TaxID=520843 RepID=A0ABD1LGD8_9FABA